MEKVEGEERCALCYAICDIPQTLPCGDIVCGHHCPSIVLGQQCPVCKKIFIPEHILRVSYLTGHETASPSGDESMIEVKDNWYGMGTKRGRERYIASPCEGFQLDSGLRINGLNVGQTGSLKHDIMAKLANVRLKILIKTGQGGVFRLAIFPPQCTLIDYRILWLRAELIGKRRLDSCSRLPCVHEQATRPEVGDAPGAEVTATSARNWTLTTTPNPFLQT
ncbi:hypothetical protein TcWFU_001671 [Taenia crassiceps]|uniref:RING-type domain-containing protein n=1 Tax=Taenia crassiceps TaxID=6207 RepID=A0ABR4Q1V1_9CEST